LRGKQASGMAQRLLFRLETCPIFFANTAYTNLNAVLFSFREQPRLFGLLGCAQQSCQLRLFSYSAVPN
jgi:hypothetical protein